VYEHHEDTARYQSPSLAHMAEQAFSDREGSILRRLADITMTEVRARPSPPRRPATPRHSTLVRRFSVTRRPHPLARDRSVSEGITEERFRHDQ
jgi:hypothetical protein